MKAKILIVEDDENIRKNLVVLFSSLEYEVSSVVTAEAALENLTDELPDLILCDINLPVMNGYMLKAKLNENKKTFEIPFVFLTARNTYDDLRKGMKLAADDFIFKPFKANDIIDSVELRLLKRKARTGSAEDDFIFLKVNNVIKKVFIKNINMVLGENQYSRFYLINGKSHLIRKSLNKWETILPEYFKRVNRSAIVNMNRIEEIEKSSSGKFLHIEGSSEKVKVTNTEILGQILHPE